MHDRLGFFRLEQVLHPYLFVNFVVAVVRGGQSAPRLESIVDFGVLHCYQGATFCTAPRQGATEGCAPRSLVSSPLRL